MLVYAMYLNFFLIYIINHFIILRKIVFVFFWPEKAGPKGRSLVMPSLVTHHNVVNKQYILFSSQYCVFFRCNYMGIGT